MILTQIALGTLLVGLSGTNLDNVPSAANTKTLECTDFGGLWKGSCQSNDGASFQTEVNIVQEDCTSIELDGESLPLDGYISGETMYQNQNLSEDRFIVTSLQNDESRLDVESQISYESNDYTEEVHTNTSLQKTGENLIVDEEMIMPDASSTHCEFRKADAPK